jgi:paired amphipathic helix protein Sin3a
MPLEVVPQPKPEDYAMFDRIKKVIVGKISMTEFIRLLNTYNQDLGAPSWIKDHCGTLINHDRLITDWLGELLPSDRNVKNLFREMDQHKPDLAKCRAFGPSYRLLPKHDTSAVCSGRDELCNEVLNDVWASHPTWDSEETGFVAHKKTPYEESLHRIEEERHDYDSNIECLTRTIQLLEPICRALQTHPDPRSFKTDTKLGGQSECIYKRIIYKLYGRYDGADVINMLQIKPYLVAPILLHRLKDTREKWKAAQRQWNEVWRHQTSANFHKSLDVQGSIRSGDKRSFQSKTLQQEIRIKREEQRNAAIKGPQRLPGQPPPKRPRFAAGLFPGDNTVRREYQYTYRFSNEEVLYDTCRLVLAEFNGRRNNPVESQVLFTRVKELLALFLSLDVSMFRGYIDNWTDLATVERNIGQRGARHVLSRLGDRTPATAANTPLPNSGLEDDDAPAPVADYDEPVQSWFAVQQPDPAQAVQGAEREITPDELIERTEFHLYGNSTIYSFFRLFGMLYDRLELLYSHEKEVRHLVDVQKMPKPAHDLHLLDSPSKEDLYFDDVSPTASFYSQTIAKFEDYIIVQDGSGQSHLEDLLRRFYMPFGWQLYHIERLLNQMEKTAIGMLMTDKERVSEQLMSLWRKDRVKERASLMDDLSYKKQAFRYLGAKDKEGEMSFRITYVSSFLLRGDSSNRTGCLAEDHAHPALRAGLAHLRPLDQRQAPPLAAVHDQLCIAGADRRSVRRRYARASASSVGPLEERARERADHRQQPGRCQQRLQQHGRSARRRPRPGHRAAGADVAQPRVRRPLRLLQPRVPARHARGHHHRRAGLVEPLH